MGTQRGHWMHCLNGGPCHTWFFWHLHTSRDHGGGGGLQMRDHLFLRLRVTAFAVLFRKGSHCASSVSYEWALNACFYAKSSLPPPPPPPPNPPPPPPRGGQLRRCRLFGRSVVFWFRGGPRSFPKAEKDEKWQHVLGECAVAITTEISEWLKIP